MNASTVLSAAITALAAALLSGCGGGNGGPASPSGSTPGPVQVSAASLAAPPCSAAVPAGSGEVATLGSAVEPQIAAIPGGNLVSVWEQDRWTGAGARAIVGAWSADGGSTWGAPVVLPFSMCFGGSGVGSAYDRNSDPWVTFAGSGVVLASALAFSASGYTAGGFTSVGGLSSVLVSRSTDGGATWSAPAEVIRTANSTSAGATQYFNDRDSIAADSSGNAYVVWDQLNNDATGTLSEPAMLATSADGGKTWSAPAKLYDPGPGNQAFANEIVILPNGKLLDVFTLMSSTASPALQVVASTNQGKTWGTAPATIAGVTSVGTPNPIAGGPAIRDSRLIAQAAADPASGNVAVVWQQSFNGAFDGVALSVSKDGGSTWSAPLQINGAPSAAAFGPMVRYLPGSVLAVTYYDLRNYASGSAVLSTSAWLTESADGGATWRELRLQSPFDLNKAPLTDLGGVGNALFLGDNQGLALVGTSALPLYAATGGSGAHVYATQMPNPLTSSGSHNY